MSDRTAPPASLTDSAAPTATTPQIKFIRDLAASREIPAEHADYMTAQHEAMDAGTMTKSFASKLIGRLLALPEIKAAPKPASELRDIVAENAPLWTVPDGYYALDNLKADEQDTNPVLFYRIKTAKSSGKQWVTRVVGGDHDFLIKGKQGQEVINRIHSDVQTAARRYGHEIGKCSCCNRTLTQRLSRELGIGPVCADKLGIDASVIEDAKATIVAAGFDPTETI
jgi:Family of unknown function (DUF6011)